MHALIQKGASSPGRPTSRPALTTAVVLVAMSLAACGERDEHMVNTKICANFKASAPTSGSPLSAAIDAASPVDECVRRWSYSLAGARDPADLVAKAAVAACAVALTRWNQAALSQPAQNGGGEQGISLTTGLPTNPLAEHSAFAQARATFYVVQARAGRCAPPPAVNGAPAGT
jgi:hypothetical protein